MIQQWPHLEERFDFVEGRLEQLVPHPSCLLASVHACGILSDILAATAAEHGVPLAVVPCCHSRKPKVLEVASPYARELYEEIILGTKGSMPDLADRLDEARIVALMNAGLSVKEEFLPDLFHREGSDDIGIPDRRCVCKRSECLSNADSNEEGTNAPALRSIQHLAQISLLERFHVPCEDTKANRRLVSNLSGRAAADDRKAAAHNRNHAKSPQMDVSLWLPEEDNGLSEQALEELVRTEHNVDCTVKKLGSVYVSPSGRKAQAFRFRYNNNGEDRRIFPFDQAKRIHSELYEMIPEVFSGAECR
ncbi:hypothetical protein ACHAXT_005114 [Thalassiosira profunda]